MTLHCRRGCGSSVALLAARSLEPRRSFRRATYHRGRGGGRLRRWRRAVIGERIADGSLKSVFEQGGRGISARASAQSARTHHHLVHTSMAINGTLYNTWAIEPSLCVGSPAGAGVVSCIPATGEGP